MTTQHNVNALDFADPAKRQEWIDTKHLDVFSMRDPANPLVTVDLFARPPLPFEDLWAHADVFHVQDRDLRVASIADLIAMKRAAGRPQDHVDAEKLERLQAGPLTMAAKDNDHRPLVQRLADGGREVLQAALRLRPDDRSSSYTPF